MENSHEHEVNDEVIELDFETGEIRNKPDDWYSRMENIVNIQIVDIDVEYETLDEPIVPPSDNSDLENGSGSEITRPRKKREVVTANEISAIVDDFWEKHAKNCTNKCLNEFSKAEATEILLDNRALDEYVDGVNRLNMMLLGVIRVILSRKRSSKHTSSDRASKTYSKRRCLYMLEGIPVCQDFFFFLHNVGKRRWSRLVEVYKKEGVFEKRHGHCNRKDVRATPVDLTRDAMQYLKNYASEHTSTTPGKKRKNNPKILPAGLRKKDIYSKYVDTCREADKQFVSKQIFLRIWRDCCKDIVLPRPKPDPCSTCSKANVTVSKSISSGQDNTPSEH